MTVSSGLWRLAAALAVRQPSEERIDEQPHHRRKPRNLSEGEGVTLSERASINTASRENLRRMTRERV
jgi:hypothetical protein